METNFHYVIDPEYNNRCLCGIYGKEAIHCESIFKDLQTIEDALYDQRESDGMTAFYRIKKVFESLEHDCK